MPTNMTTFNSRKYYVSRSTIFTTKKAEISEGNLVRENVKSLSNSVTKFCDQGICEEFYFFRHKFPSLILFFLVVINYDKEKGLEITIFSIQEGGDR
jgi:hypothetical protein